MRIKTPEVMALVHAAFPEYKGKRINVESFRGPMTMQSYWSGGSRDYWSVVNMDTLKSIDIPENGTTWNPAIGPLKELPLNGAVVRYTMGPHESVGVYVNPANLNQFLLPETTELSRDHKIVLAATSGLKSSYGGIKNYRFHEASERTGITLERWEAAKAQLVKDGYLNKAGAITDNGRNAIGRTDLYQLREIP